jgi:hypothetical protein
LLICAVLLAAVLAVVPILGSGFEDDVGVVLSPRDPDVVIPAESLLPPQAGPLELWLGVDLVGVLVELLARLLLELLLNDLELPLLLLLLPLDPRAKTSPQKETTKTKATIRAATVRANLNGFLFIVTS